MEKNKRFELRLSEAEKSSLRKLAEQTSKDGSSVIRELISLAANSPHILSSNQAKDGRSN